MEKRINPPDDPRRLWKIQLAVALLTAAWIFAVNATARADGDGGKAPPPSVTAYAVEALPAPDSPVPLPPVMRADEPVGDGGDLPVGGAVGGGGDGACACVL